jgi:hypothetical protein
MTTDKQTVQFHDLWDWCGLEVGQSYRYKPVGDLAADDGIWRVVSKDEDTLTWVVERVGQVYRYGSRSEAEKPPAVVSELVRLRVAQAVLGR